MGQRCSTLVLFLVGALVGSAQAGGDPADHATLGKAAKRAFLARTYEKAARLYVQAFQASARADAPKPDYLYNASVAFRFGELPADAYDHLLVYLAQPANVNSRDRAERTLKELEEQLRPGWPTLKLYTKPPGAKAELSGKGARRACTTPCDLDHVRPGEYDLFARLDGHSQKHLRVEAVHKVPQTLNLDLEPSKGAGTATLNVAPDGALVRLDGDPIGTAPVLEPITRPEGSYWLTVEAPDFKTWTGPLLIRPDKPAEVVVDLVSALPPPPPPPFPWHQSAQYIGVGALALGATGLTFGLLAEDLDDQLSDERRDTGRADPDGIDRMELYTDIQTGFYIGAGLAAITAGAFWYAGLESDPVALDPDVEPLPDTALVPLVGPGLVGLALSGALR